MAIDNMAIIPGSGETGMTGIEEENAGIVEERNIERIFEDWKIRDEQEKREGKPRKSYDHNSVIWNFFYSKDRQHYRRGSRVFYEEDRLYSYGYHYLLAVRTEYGGYVINADKYSISTSGHQSTAISKAPEGTPQIPFSALRSAGINPKQIDIIDKTGDTWEEKQVRDEHGDITTVKVHHLGACLFRHGGTFYLSSLDHASRGRQYFLVQLRAGADSVEEALKQISGLTKEDYDAYERGEIKRQGEYFFKPIETGEFRELLKRNGYKSVGELLEKRVNLGERINNGRPTRNEHRARDFIHTLLTGALVRGTVRHPEHGMLRLGKVWHRVSLNDVVNSWSAGGRVD
ncbi:MAG: hypothetical protein EFT35_09130 [Methanophagales archaeon ANME-1-THS]|nr:MAG: hypothetical protein EFT35_09130 [Methanophagales archaeon ANME-1-THS]